MALVAVTLLVVAGGRPPDQGSGDDRLFALAGQLKCLQCVGESVANSQAPLADQFRTEISEQMDAGATDDEILNYFADRYGEQVLLDPPSSGLGALVWVLPVLALAATIIGLGFAFRRWRLVPEGTGTLEPAAAPPATGGGGGARSAPAPRWRVPAIAAGVVVFLVLAGWLVVWGADDRGGGELTGAAGSRAAELARCQPLAMREPAAAIDCYDEILDGSPDDVEALTYRGWANVRAEHVDAGMADLDRAVELDPNYPDARVFRAVVAANAGDFATAAEELQVFYANDPSEVAVQIVQTEGLDRKVFFGLMSAPTRECWQAAAAAGDGGAIDQAFLDSLGTCLDGVLAATPGDRDAELSRALAHMGPQQSDTVAARLLLDDLLSAQPDDADALSLLVSLDIAAGDLDAAATGLERLEALPRGDAAFLIGDAATLRQAYDAARQAALPNPDGG